MVVSETIGQEALLFGISIMVGAGLFLLYDVLRIFRRIAPHGNLWISVEDFVYWLICTGVVFVMLYWENDGMVRGFALIGLVLGMVLYYLLLSRYVVSVNVRILKTVLGYIHKILHFFFAPILKIGKKVGQFLIKRLKKIARAVKIGLCKL